MTELQPAQNRDTASSIVLDKQGSRRTAVERDWVHFLLLIVRVLLSSTVTERGLPKRKARKLLLVEGEDINERKDVCQTNVNKLSMSGQEGFILPLPLLLPGKAIANAAHGSCEENRFQSRALLGQCRQISVPVVRYGILPAARLGADPFEGEPERPRPHRVPGYPWTSAIFVLAGAAMTADTLVTQPLRAMVELGIVLAGVPAYFIWHRINRPQTEPLSEGVHVEFPSPE
jgi:hypothetical protein